jgi:hypothetical protein
MMLDIVMNARRFRRQSLESQELAAAAAEPAVRARYVAIAKHYADLADAEERAARSGLEERLRQHRAKALADLEASRLKSKPPATETADAG